MLSFGAITPRASQVPISSGFEGKRFYRAVIKLIKNFKAWFIMNESFYRFCFLASLSALCIWEILQEISQMFCLVCLYLSIYDMFWEIKLSSMLELLRRHGQDEDWHGWRLRLSLCGSYSVRLKLWARFVFDDMDDTIVDATVIALAWLRLRWN